MAIRSNRITLWDIRGVTDAVHECGELWADPLGWQAHLMARASQLAGCRIGLYFEMGDDAGHCANRVLAAHDVGWESDGERRTLVAGLALQPLRYSPLWANFADALACRGNTSAGLTAPQDRLIARSTWQASEMYDRHVRPTRLGQVLLSAVWMPHLTVWSAWSLVTDRGDAGQTIRHERLTRLFHRQIAPLIGTRLSTFRDRNLSTLSSTRRGVLDALLDGVGESEIASQAFRSHSAIHEHVTALYRHFGVRSRAELAAYFLRRRPTSAGRSAKLPSMSAWLKCRRAI